MSFAFLGTPAIARRWQDPESVAALAERWRACPALRLEDALLPGIAAELAAWVSRLPIGMFVDDDRMGAWWSSDIDLPPLPDPHLPECFFRLARFLQVDVPALLLAMTGRRFAPVRHSRFSVRTWRKGSFADRLPGDAAGIEAVVGLTAATWPVELGGVHEVYDEAGAVIAHNPPGWNTLDLIAGIPPQQMTVVTRHVEVVTVHTTLVEQS